MQDIKGPRVMIVEDQAILSMELELVLTEAGHTVVGCAMDLAGAVALAGRSQPDVALVDVNLLDGFTGPDVAKVLVGSYGTTVIFLTANPEQIPKNMTGVLGLVAKPFDEKTILEAVSFAAEHRASGRVQPAPRRFWLAAHLT